MPPSPISDSPSPPTPTGSDDAGNDIQPFFVLHKATQQKAERKASGSFRAKRKIDLPPFSPLSKPPEKSEAVLPTEQSEAIHEQRRFEAFHQAWSKIDDTIKEVLRQININLFEEVHRWVLESFAMIKSSRPSNLAEIQKPYPLLTDHICNQIPAALIFTKNAEFVDDLLTFQELGGHLRSQGCHVANLSSLDFSVKHGIGNCLRSILRQLVKDAPDMADIAVLASWYSELENYDCPIILIIDDIERCSGAILGQLIRMLSEWAIKLPILFVMGVATTIEAPRRILQSDSLHIHSCKFTLGSPSERMNALVEAVLVKLCSGFKVGHEVAVFLRRYFLNYDGTITSFIKALKLACIKHFSSEPLSYLGLGISGEDFEIICKSKCDALSDTVWKSAFDLPSCKRTSYLKSSNDELVQGICELRRLLKAWSSVVLCLSEVGNHNKIQLLDIFCEATDPTLSCLRTSDNILQASILGDDNPVRGKIYPSKGGYIAQAIQKVRDSSMPSLAHLLNVWSIHTQEMKEIHNKVEELQSAIASADGEMIIKEQQIDSRRRLTSLSMGKATPSLNDKAALLLDSMVRKILIPIECIEFHEIVCFKDVDNLNAALMGDPRGTIQIDLLNPQTHLQCRCCSGKNAFSSSMHDTSVMYHLAQEYGDLINLHDWYQSFKAAVCTPSCKPKCKSQHSPSSKKVKTTDLETEASLQARFCRAATELQITGLLQMPSKRRPDFVQRIAFGL